MGATRTAAREPLLERFERQTAALLTPASRVCVGLSGGMDSVVLLHLFAQWRARCPLELNALHVHHGLNPRANQWADFCQNICDKLNIALTIRRVTVNPSSGLGIEASAREARYRAFDQETADYIALAHHRDDQAETLLLQLLRGAGIKGLSGMPLLRHRHRNKLIRPLLEIERSELRTWAENQQLEWIEDDSNDDNRYARNFLRHKVLPIIGEQHAAWRSTLARSAQLLGETASLLEELASLDAEKAIHDRVIDCRYLRTLSAARARNLLRYFLAQQGLGMPSQQRLEDIHQQLITTGNDKRIAIPVGTLVLRRFRRHAYLTEILAVPDPHLRWLWQGEAQQKLPELGGTLHFGSRERDGLKLAGLGQINIRLRQGGEHFQPDCRRPRRALKDLLQEAELPPWERERLPLIYSDNELVLVPGIGTACGWQAQPGEAALNITWRTDDSSAQ